MIVQIKEPNEIVEHIKGKRLKVQCGECFVTVTRQALLESLEIAFMGKDVKELRVEMDVKTVEGTAYIDNVEKITV